MKANENSIPGPVDVLAVMENLAHAVQADMDESDCRRTRAGIREARAAVAALVEAALAVAGPNVGIAPRDRKLHALRAALAKFGGAK